MHEFEALLGILLSIHESKPDASLQEVLETIKGEQLGGSILDKVRLSAFGPDAIKSFLRQYPLHTISSKSIAAALSHSNHADCSEQVASTPTNAWQAAALQKFFMPKSDRELS